MKNTLPNATAVLVLGILSILFCWCYGVVGLILGGVALFLASKDMKLYRENPELYSNYGNLNTGLILAIIGLALSTIYTIFTIYLFVVIGPDGWTSYMENLKVKVEQEDSDY